MRILRHYWDVPVTARGAVVAIGNFDGVHRGHEAVIAEAHRVAARCGAASAVLTFEPHPRVYFDPQGPEFRLTSLRTKAHRIEALGVELLFVARFDRAFSLISARDFVTEVLVKGLQVRHVVVGYDFVFGHERAGDIELLASMAKGRGFGISVVDPVASEGEVYSSSRIRVALRNRNPRLAAELLGHWWEVEGRVRRGESRGHRLGYPTANLQLGDLLQPALGIYAVRAVTESALGVWTDGVASLGRRPTFGGGDVVLEVHLFDFAGDLYGRYLRVAFVDYIREEKKFDDIAGLTSQMAADCRAARRILAETEARGESAPGRKAEPRRAGS